MKKIAFLSAIFCLLSSSFIAFGQKNKKSQQAPPEPLFTHTVDGKSIFYNEIGAPIPRVNFKRRDGKTITNESLKNTSPLFVILFNPTCEHCELMAKELKANINLFKSSPIVFLAAQGMESYIPNFVKITDIGAIPKLQVAIDNSMFIQKTFLYKTLPQINVYNKERMLEKIFLSNVPIDSLRQYIE